jgi:hypothetical protein
MKPSVLVACAFLLSPLYESATPSEADAPSSPPAVDVHLVADEPEAVLAILAKKKAGQEIAAADWQRLFASEGYVRLKRRETAMKAPFEDSDFQAFVLSAPLAERGEALGRTLAAWTSADLGAASRLALAYLPPDARIRAKIYPVIKPRTNSFVFEVGTDPAIFFYLDPEMSREKLTNTLAHELHHIGYGSRCPVKAAADDIARRPEGQKQVFTWLGAFGEGFAMLAAAGGPDVHPHAVSRTEDRERWDRDLSHFNGDLKKVEGFFLDLLAGKLSAEQIDETAMSFFGVQGPWYTVGWKMAVVIEKTYGRKELLECECDPRRLLSTYNWAAKIYTRKTHEPLALWSEGLARTIEGRHR